MNMTPEGFVFEEAMERIRRVTGLRTQVEIAAALDIRQSSISDAKRRQNIPDGWLVRLLLDYGLSPRWILTGEGEAYLQDDPERQTPEGLGPRREERPAPTVAELVQAIETQRPESQVRLLPRGAEVVIRIAAETSDPYEPREARS